MAKVLAYKEQIEYIIPGYCELEADAQQDLILDAVLGFKDFEAIENLYIDLKIIQDFVPQGMTIFEAYEPTAHLIGSMKMISTNGLLGANSEEHDEANEQDSMEDDESDMHDEKSEDDDLTNQIKRVSHKWNSRAAQHQPWEKERALNESAGTGCDFVFNIKDSDEDEVDGEQNLQSR